MRRGVPAKRIGDRLVTTVFDLLCAQLGVGRDGLPGDWPTGYDDPQPGTPAWQQEHTERRRGLVTRIAREFARNAEVTEGRSMIVMGAGTNHWFHGDQIYRGMLSMRAALRLPGRQRRRLGALRRPGEGPPDHRVRRRRVRDRLDPPAAPAGHDVVLVPGDRPVALRALRRRRADEPARAPARSRASTSPTPSRSRRGWAGCRATRPSTATRSTSATRRQAAGKEPARARHRRAAGRAPALRRRGPRRPGELPARADALAGEPARLVVQGPRVLPQAPARRSTRPRPRDGDRRRASARPRSSGGTRRPPGSSTSSPRSTSA